MPDSDWSERWVWFFLPTQHPLPMPDKWILRVKRSIESGADAELSPNEASIMVHQVERTGHPLASDLTDLWRAAASLTASDDSSGDEDSDSQSAVDPPHSEWMTLIEVAQYQGDQDLDSSFESAVEIARNVQSSISTVTQQPVELISTMTLPFMIPAFVGQVFDDGRKPQYDNLIPFLVGPNWLTAIGHLPEPMTESQLSQIAQASEAAALGLPYSEVTDLRREALVQLDLYGNWRLAAISTAAAGEVLLNTILMQMLWEERVAPEEAALDFHYGEGHAHRIATRFAPRLGDNWSTGGQGVIARYLKSVVGLRNQLMHGGRPASEEEAIESWDALVAVNEFLGDRLTSDQALKTYTRTAITFCGNDGLAKRGRMTRHVKSLQDDPREPAWTHTFDAYRHLVQQFMTGEPAGIGDDFSQVQLIFERYGVGFKQWFLHDVGTNHAARVDASHFIKARKTERMLRRHRKRQVVDELPDPVRTRVMFEEPRNWDATKFSWRPLHEISPSQPIYPGPVPRSPPAKRIARFWWRVS